MIIVLKKNLKNEKEHIVDYLSGKEFLTRKIQGESDTIINVSDIKIDDNRFCVMGGSCTEENAEQINTVSVYESLRRLFLERIVILHSFY